VLRVADGRVKAQVDWLMAAGAQSHARVVRAFLSWPQLATTSVAMLQQRWVSLHAHSQVQGSRPGLSSSAGSRALLPPFAATSSLQLPPPPRLCRHTGLQSLLGASDEDMRRICSVYPNLLARDLGVLSTNMASMQQLLRVDEARLKAIVLREPGLLSYSTATLATRWSYVVQVRPRGAAPPSAAASRWRLHAAPVAGQRRAEACPQPGFTWQAWDPSPCASTQRCPICHRRY
jgi:hypothetical protein